MSSRSSNDILKEIETYHRKSQIMKKKLRGDHGGVLQGQ